VTLAKQVMDDIIQYGKVRRAVLGINIGDVDPNDAQVAGLKDIHGVKVAGFDPPDDPESSPAKRAGVEVGDVIIGVNGQSIDRVSTLQRVIRNFKPGQNVSLDVMRFGDKKTLNVKLGEPPADRSSDVASANDDSRQPASRSNERSYDKLGISVQSVPTELAQQAKLSDQWRRGLLVTDVSPSGPAYHELNENSSIIISVLYPKKREIRSTADLEDAVSSLKRGDLITLLVYDVRAQGTTSITLRAQ
jgi:serine protease Do